MGVAMNQPIAVFRRWLREHEAQWRGKPFRELDLDRLFFPTEARDAMSYPDRTTLKVRVNK
jgi:hypothetical protein